MNRERKIVYEYALLSGHLAPERACIIQLTKWQKDRGRHVSLRIAFAFGASRETLSFP